ncbi:MAG: DUF6544 family protein [bacterium]
MKWLFFVLLAVHGLIHLLGTVKAFGLAPLEELPLGLSRGAGVAWLAAGILMLASALLLLLRPELWWWAGAAAVVLSQALIFSAWGEAKFGTAANLIVLAGVVYGFASMGPWSLRADYLQEVREGLADPPSLETVTEADLTPLPAPVQRYVRRSGAVGLPRVRDFALTWSGRIRGAPDEPWMEFEAVQHSFLDTPRRLFHMRASRSGLPVDILHVYREGTATMRVRLLSLLPMVDARGPEMDRAETVTFLNDLCLFAPAGLIDPDLEWEAADDRTARVRYTAGPHTVGATLYFDEEGDLVDFVSEDRLRASADGTEFTRHTWSTPVSGQRTFGERRISAGGDGVWHLPDGEFVYIEAEVLDLEVNTGH